MKEDLIRDFLKTAREQRRFFGDRQNRDTTLTGDQATALVNILGNACTALEDMLAGRDLPMQEPKA